MNNDQCEDSLQTLKSTYGGAKIINKISKNLILENGIIFSTTRLNELFSKQKMDIYEIQNKIFFDTKNGVYPFINMSIGKTNMSKDLYYRVGIGVTIGKSPFIFKNTPIASNIEKPTIAYAPNIYLYPEKSQMVDVKVFPNGEIISSYPLYKNGWSVKVEPNGSIENTPGYLFYDATVTVKPPDQGWFVAHNQLYKFLKKTLFRYGLNKTEIRDFIVFWLATLPQSPYYAIYPIVNEKVEEICQLKINPTPDNLLRLWFAFKPLSKKIKIKSPVIPPLKRDGFTVIEWGGIIVD